MAHITELYGPYNFPIDVGRKTADGFCVVFQGQSTFLCARFFAVADLLKLSNIKIDNKDFAIIK